MSDDALREQIEALRKPVPLDFKRRTLSHSWNDALEAVLALLRRSEPQPVLTDDERETLLNVANDFASGVHEYYPDGYRDIAALIRKALAEPQPAPSPPTCAHGSGADCTIPVWSEYHGQYFPCPGPPRSNEPSAEERP